MARPKGSSNRHPRCECGHCKTCYQRARYRLIAAGKVMAKPNASRGIPKTKPTTEPAFPSRGWGSLEACSLGGVASLIARNQAAYFARRRAVWAAQIAAAIAP